MRRLLPILALGLSVSACATLPEPAQPDTVAKAVEPSLRAAAAAAEAQGDWKGAAQHWGTLYQRHGGGKDLGLALARALRNGGAPQQAADLMQGELARHGRDPALLAELGKDYLAADRLGLALKALEEAASLAPGQWEALSALGVALDLSGRYDEAARAYDSALAAAPDHPALLNNLALSQAMAGRLDQALATMARANEQPGAGMQVRQNLALLLALKGDSATAERLAAKDLPAEAAGANARIYRALAGARLAP